MTCENNGYHLSKSPLVRDERDVWRMDFEDMERRIVDEHIHVAIICSPHNPCGRVWDRWELETAMDLFARHDVWVISDEIWSDLTLRQNRHVPTQLVNDWAHEHTIALYAPSKTFNLAGLIGSYAITYNPWLRDRLDKESSLSHYNAQNVLSMHALIGAYSEEGAEWCDQLCDVLAANTQLVYTSLITEPGVQCALPEGTYVLLADFRSWADLHGISYEDVPRLGWDVGVTWHDGQLFDCPGFVRIAASVPTSQVREACSRMERYILNG
jgi:cystathionine beta-lyase